MSPSKHALPLINVLMATTLCASKSQECTRRVRDVVNVYHLMYHFYIKSFQNEDDYTELPYVSADYYRWRDKATKAELIILDAVGFECQPLVLPSSLLASYLNALELHREHGIVQQAMNFLNDAGLSPVYYLYSMATIVCAAIWLACEGVERLPLKWHEVFDVFEKEMIECAETIKAVYTISFRYNLLTIDSITNTTAATPVKH